MGSKNVVVVGGGISGSLLAKELQSHANVTLIDLKEYFSIPWAMGRAMIDPSFAEKSLINYRDFLPNVELITSGAIGITDEVVITTNGDAIPYDYLVIATGHEDRSPESRHKRILQCQEAREKISAAKSVLIVGGGPGGVELASEIATAYNTDEKKVILVHRGSRLLEYIGLKASQKALDWLTSKNVKVVLDQTVNLDSFSRDGVIKTSYGETITADYHLDCTGRKIGSMWLTRSVLRDSLDLQGRVMVDENMRVKGHHNVFAIGDITNVPELKQGFLAMRHAQVAAKNLKILMDGGCNNRMATYTASRPMAFVSLGRREGVAQIFWLTMCGRFPGMVKSNDLFVGKIRKRYGIHDKNCH